MVGSDVAMAETAAQIARRARVGRFASWTPVLINGVAFVLMAAHYAGSGLPRAPLSYRYMGALPTAITEWRGIAHDGTAAVELSEFFKARGTDVTDNDLLASTRMPIVEPQNRIVAFTSDDQGHAVFVRWSFAIFGLSLLSPHKMFFLVLGLSLLTFVAAHFTRPEALACSTWVVLALYAVLPVLGVSSQLAGAIDPRFMGVLATIPTLHLCLDACGRRLSSLDLLALVLQSSIIAATFQIRSSSGWSLLCVALVAVIVSGAAFVKEGRVRSVTRPLVPLLVVMIMFAAGSVWQRSRLGGALVRAVPSQHVFWHAIHVGFGLHPQFAREDGLTLDDMPAYEHVFRSLRAANDDAALRAAFGGDGHRLVPGDIQWVAYERATRGVVLDMVRSRLRHPWSVVELFAYYKPLMLARTALWAAGVFHGSVETIGMSPSWLITELRRRETDAYIRLFRPAILIILIANVAALMSVGYGADGRARLIPGVAVVLAMTATAILPAFVVIPAFHWIGELLVLGCASVYGLTTQILAVGLRAMARDC